MEKVILSILFAIFFLSNYAQNVTMGDIQRVASEYYKSKNAGLDLDYEKIIPIADDADTLFYV